MFNVRSDKFWRWIRVPTLTDDPPGFRLADEGSVLPNDINGDASNRPADKGYSLEPSTWAAPSAVATFPFVDSSPLWDAASLIFPRLYGPRFTWPGLQDANAAALARPDTSVPGFNVATSEDDLPGFRVAPDSLARNPLPNDLSPMFFDLNPAAMAAPAASFGVDGVNTPVDIDHSFKLFGRQEAATSAIPSFSGGALPPRASSYLFPWLDGSLPTWLSLQDDSGQPDSASNAPMGDFEIAPQMDAGLTPFGYLPAEVTPPTAVDLSEQPLPTKNAYNYGTYPVPSALQSDPVQDALGQVARIYAGFEGTSNRVLNRQASNIDSIGFPGREGSGRTPPAISEALDPRYLVPVQAPPRPPVGPGHNGGPPLRPTSPSLPPQPSRPVPAPNPRPSSPPDTSSSIAGAAAAATPSSEQEQEALPNDAEIEAKLQALQQIARGREEQTPHDQYLRDDGIKTLIGVQLNPKLGMPYAGRYHYPSRQHLRDGYQGELILANRIAALLPEEVVIHYGMPAGRNGPDVISLSPKGTISIWDSKWRGGQRGISPNDRGHQTKKSLEGLRWEILRSITAAVDSGRLSADVAAVAKENLRDGNFDIYTIGTGSAHGGVLQSVQKHEPQKARKE